jgi:hypothetical protein
MYWVVSPSEQATTNYACFILAYIAIIVIVTLTVLSIVNFRKRRNNPLVPATDRPTPIMKLNEGISMDLKFALVAVIFLLSTGIFLIFIAIVD